MAQIREESRARKAKEKNIVLSGMREGTNVDEKENEADDWVKTCNLIKQIRLDNQDDIIENAYRRGNRAGGVRQLVVELINTENREIELKHSKYRLEYRPDQK